MYPIWVAFIPEHCTHTDRNIQFNPLIISGFGFSTEKTSLLASPQAAVATFFPIVSSIVADLVPNIRCLIWVLSTLPGIIGAVLIRSTSSAYKTTP